MITLYKFGPRWGLTDPSPFVMKAETLLRMAQLPYKTSDGGLRGAPKGKLPYIEDGGEKIADSTFIRWHLENAHRVDFDRGLSVEQRAVAWAFEKMAEDNLYWVVLDERWMNDENFRKGPSSFFVFVPPPMRSLVKTMVRRSVKRNLHGQGMGRHSALEKLAIGTRSVEAISDYLAQKPFFMGTEPVGADATIFSFVAGILCPLFETPLRAEALRRPNLAAYVGRMTARYYPELGEMAGCRAAA
jgi:glutathione S-transferase